MTEYLYKLKKERKKHFVLEIGISEFIVYHNNKKHTITAYKPAEIRDTESNAKVYDDKKNVN